MTHRSYLYFKIQRAHKLLSTETGRRSLAEKGLFPIGISFDLGYHKTNDKCFMIDKKGNIVGTSKPTAVIEQISRTEKELASLAESGIAHSKAWKDLLTAAESLKFERIPLVTDWKTGQLKEC